MSAAVFCPGPTNQKSVPGLRHCAVASPPALVCSASSPRAIDPLAWIITPPRAGPVGTEAPAAAADGADKPRARAGAGATFTSDSWPGCVRTCSGAGGTAAPAGDRRITSAWPVPDDAAASASPDAVAPADPGAGHARSAVDTVARAGAGDRGPAATAAGRLMLARPN